MLLLASLILRCSAMLAPRVALPSPLLAPRRAVLAACTESVSAPVNITFREESDAAEPCVPDVSLTRSRDGSTGTATFRFERPRVLSFNDVWDNGLITGIYLSDEEGALQSTDLSVEFVDGRPQTLVALVVLKSPDEWNRFMRFMKRYAETNDLAFERSPRAETPADG